MESVLKFLDRIDGLYYACRLLWPGRPGQFLRMCLLLTGFILIGP